MLPERSRPFLMLLLKRRKRLPSAREEMVPQSGIYRVRHRSHRVPHEVTLLRDQYFPRCANCDTAVIFELGRAVPDESETAILSPANLSV